MNKELDVIQPIIDTITIHEEPVNIKSDNVTLKRSGRNDAHVTGGLAVNHLKVGDNLNLYRIYSSHSKVSVSTNKRLPTVDDVTTHTLNIQKAPSPRSPVIKYVQNQHLEGEPQARIATVDESGFEEKEVTAHTKIMAVPLLSSRVDISTNISGFVKPRAIHKDNSMDNSIAEDQSLKSVQIDDAEE